MNTKNNKRKKTSQDKIEKAFVELIQTKEINEISVIEIVKKAKVNRSTFYTNYLDIYDLADKIKEQLEKNVSNLYQDEIIKGYNSNDYLKIFKHVKENQLFYKTYFKLNYDKNYVVKQYDTQQAKEYFDNKFIDYHITFFMNGFNAIVRKWLNNGCKETPEEMANIIHSEYNGRIENLKNNLSNRNEEQ